MKKNLIKGRSLESVQNAVKSGYRISLLIAQFEERTDVDAKVAGLIPLCACIFLPTIFAC